MLNLLELEGVKPEPKTRPFVKESKPPDSTIITQLSQLQEWTKPPIFTLFNLRTSSDESNGLSKDRTRLYSVLKESLTSAQARSNFYTDKRRSERWLTTVDWVYLGLQTHIQTSVALERIFYLDLRGVACQFQLIHWSNTSSFKLDFAEASEFATCENDLKLVVLPARVSTKPVMSSDGLAAIELLFLIHHNSWTAATTPTSFSDENRFRSRPEKQIKVSPVENRTLKRARIRRCTMVQLLVFDPGGNGSFEDEGLSRS
ncbi:hypothetical protein LWI28_014053 [Acer negundo]|uniref:Uncharacterized protein n=1 Tax=Acer negundo TaxID=4023 RepID=A0AAD5P761_ACENE|nr:hypothetical protein LWI28_014053 [Acer negundo]